MHARAWVAWVVVSLAPGCRSAGPQQPIDVPAERETSPADAAPIVDGPASVLPDSRQSDVTATADVDPAARPADAAKSPDVASAEVPPPQPPTGAWVEREGLVVVEAEHGRGDWTVIQDPACVGGRCINDPGSGSMAYELLVQKTGRWYVFLRALRGTATAATDDENDVIVEVNGARLFGSDGQTRPEGMRVHGSAAGWTWTFLPKGPGSHTPDAIRDGNVHFAVGRPGAQRLVLRHRSKNISVDRILLRHEGLPNATQPPADSGPAETR